MWKMNTSFLPMHIGIKIQQAQWDIFIKTEDRKKIRQKKKKRKENTHTHTEPDNT